MKFGVLTISSDFITVNEGVFFKDVIITGANSSGIQASLYLPVNKTESINKL